MTEPEIRYSVETDILGAFAIVRESDGVEWESDVAFTDEVDAFHFAYGRAFNERERLGWPPGDPRIVFPERPKGAG